MSVPYVPRADFSIYSDDPDTLIKGATNGIELGPYRDLDPKDYNSWLIMFKFTPKNILPKVFYAKTTPPSDQVNVVVCSNIEDNNHDLYHIKHDINWETITDPGYKLFTNKVGLPYDVGGGVYVYYTTPTAASIAHLNPLIPLFDSIGEGLIQANNEGWVYRNPDDPYEFDDNAISYAGGGTGKFDNASDTIGVPALPTLSAVSAGFVTMYTPTLTQLNNLASFLWTDNVFDPDNFKKLFTDPMECIIGLTIVPVNPSTSGSQSIKVGYVDTGVSASRLSSQYAEVNCGTLQADEFWGSALDYSPFTKIHIYLPYVGMREINADDIMGKSVGVVYHIDLLSGACTAFVTAGGSVLYQFNGQCSINIPMAASNFTEMIHSAISAIGAVAMTASGAGAASSAVDAAAVGTAAQMGASAANSAISSKPTFSHSGQMGGSGGMLAVQTPYIIIERPRQCVAADVNKFKGFPSNINYKLYDLTGYTVVESIHLDGFDCTDNEANEILSLLKGGVIL